MASKGKKKLTDPVCKFGITFTDIAEGDIRMYTDGAFDGAVHFLAIRIMMLKLTHLPHETIPLSMLKCHFRS
jgi:hypothetical protein